MHNNQYQQIIIQNNYVISIRADKYINHIDLIKDPCWYFNKNNNDINNNNKNNKNNWRDNIKIIQFDNDEQLNTNTINKIIGEIQIQFQVKLINKEKEIKALQTQQANIKDVVNNIYRNNIIKMENKIDNITNTHRSL